MPILSVSAEHHRLKRHVAGAGRVLCADQGRWRRFVFLGLCRNGSADDALIRQPCLGTDACHHAAAGWRYLGWHLRRFSTCQLLRGAQGSAAAKKTIICLSGSSLSLKTCIAWPWKRSLFRYSSGGLASPGSTCELDLDQISCHRRMMFRMDEQHTTNLGGK